MQIDPTRRSRVTCCRRPNHRTTVQQTTHYFYRMENSTNQTNVCQVSVAIAEQPIVIVAVVGSIIVNLAAIFLSLILIYLLFRFTATFHRNTRLLLANLSLSLILMSTGSTVRGVFYLTRVTGNPPECPFLEKYSTCSSLQNPRTCGIISLQLSLVSVAIERAWATVKYKKYEDMLNPVPVLLGILVQVRIQ